MENRNHILKRVLACVMVVVMTLTAVPMSGFIGLELPKWSEMFATKASAISENGYTYTVSGGKATITAVASTVTGDVVIPDTLGGYPVTEIGGSNKSWGDLGVWSGAFQARTDLTSLTMPEGLTSIADYAFYNCSRLTNITIPESVTNISHQAFAGCTGLTKINWNAKNVSIQGDYYDEVSVFTDAGTASDGIEVVFGDTVESIPDFAFCCSDCGDGYIANVNIKSVTIGNGVKNIGKYAFYGCNGLTNVTIPDSVESIGTSAFAGTAWLDAQPYGDVYAGKVYYKYKGTMPENTSIVIKDGTKGIAGEAFYDKRNLVEITIPDSVTNIGNSSFRNCSFKNITIPDSVQSIGNYAFSDCDSISRIEIPGNVKTIGDGAFEYCSDLQYIFIEDGVEKIGDVAFCHASIKQIVIPDSVTEIGSGAFSFCGSLSSVTIGNGIEVIEGGAFNDCPNLTEIKLGRNIKTIEEDAFTGLLNFPEVYFAGSEEEWQAVSVDSSNDMLLRGNMHYNADISHTHSYTETVTKPVTCTENGLKTFTCTCGKSYTETILTTGHNYQTETVAATCTSIGYETKTCRNCGDSQFVRALPATGHTPSDWKTDSAKGIRYKDCTTCGQFLEAEKIAECAHNFVTKTTKPTCTASGFETKTCSTCGECLFVRAVPATGHSFKSDITPATCTASGFETKTCSACGECHFVRVIPATGHSLVTAVTPATQTESGISVTSCKTCAAITKATLIKRIASVSLSKTAFTYNGKVQTPTVTVKDSSGKVLKNGTDYKVKYSSGRKNPGQYSVTVTFKGNYSGKKPLTFTIVPAAPTLSVTAGAKKATLKWNKQTGATGYIVYMATSKSGKFSKIATLKGNSKISYTKTGLTKGKTYYFKVCAYTTAGGKNINGTFSAVKSVKVK